MLDLDALNFDKSGGVVTVVTQDADTGVVLMVAAANRHALERTIASREMHYTAHARPVAQGRDERQSPACSLAHRRL